MDVAIILLYDLIMKWFDDLHILFATRSPRCGAWVDKTFDGYGVVNHCHAGRLRWSMSGQAERWIEAPVTWITWPGPRWRFGLHAGEGHWEHRCVGFAGPRLERFMDRGLLPTDRHPPLFTPQNPEGFRLAFDALIDGHRQGAEARSVHRLEGLLLRLDPGPGPVTGGLSTLRDLGEAIREDPGRAWNFKGEAKARNMSLVHFRRRFVETLGHPPHRFLLEARLQRAAAQLRDTTEPIKGIAAGVGMPDIYHFSRRFKARFHLPPARYRRESSF